DLGGTEPAKRDQEEHQTGHTCQQERCTQRPLTSQERFTRGDENAAEQGTQGDRAPPEEPVHRVHPAQEVIGDDPLPQGHRDHIPLHDRHAAEHPASHTTTAEEVSPTAARVTTSTAMATSRLTPEVRLAAIRSATSDPSTAPTAVPVMTAPYCHPWKSPRISWAKSTMNTNATAESMFIPPRRSAKVRRRRCRHSHRIPSPISRRQRILPVLVWPCGRNEPLSETTSTTPAASSPALEKKGTASAMAIRTPPSGGPAKLFIAVSAPQSRPLARSRCSLPTTEAISV